MRDWIEPRGLRGLLVALVLAVATDALAADDSWENWAAIGQRGDVALARGELAKAEAAYLEAIAMAGRLGSPLALEPNMSRLVATWARREQCGQAESRLRASLASLTEKAQVETRAALEPLSLLALLVFARGELEPATELLRRVQALVEKTDGAETPELAPVLTLLAFLQRAQAPAEADALLARAVALRQKPLRDDPLDRALSQLLRAWTRPPDQALKQWAGALTEAERLVGKRHPALAIARSAHAELLESHGKAPAARSMRAQAERIRRNPLCSR